MSARSEIRAGARTTTLVAPDAIHAPGQSETATQMQHVRAACALIVAFAIVTLFIVRALAAG